MCDFNHLSSNAFKSIVDIDLLGSFNTVKATFDQLRKNKGAILFVSATLHYYGVPYQIGVGAAKAGVDALSNAFAVELGPLGIRSNCIAPGPIDGTEGLLRLSRASKDQTSKKVPLQRLGTTQDIADGTVYLFSQQLLLSLVMFWLLTVLLGKSPLVLVLLITQYLSPKPTVIQLVNYK